MIIVTFQKKLFWLSAVAILLSSMARGQEAQLGTLTIGDKVPDIELKLFKSDSIKEAHIGDYMGEALLIDTWDTGCPSCMLALPKMAAIQNEFAGKIRVIVYSGNTTTETKKLIQKLPSRLKQAAGELWWCCR